MNYTGRHILAEFYGCSPTLLDDLCCFKMALYKAAVEAKCHPVGDKFHQFKPQGITGVILLEESHISGHSYPEHGFISLDIYCCGQKAEPRKALDKLIELFKPEKYDFTEITRGH